MVVEELDYLKDSDRVCSVVDGQRLEVSVLARRASRCGGLIRDILRTLFLHVFGDGNLYSYHQVASGDFAVQAPRIARPAPFGCKLEKKHMTVTVLRDVSIK